MDELPKFRCLMAIALICSLPMAVHAQDRRNSPATLFAWRETPEPAGELGAIVTDRPDFTEASSTVGLGVIQLEAGYTFSQTRDATETHSHSWGEPLLRVGMLANWLEFRIAYFPLAEAEKFAGISQTRSGAEDLYLGFKIGLTPQDGWLPETAVMPQMTVPTGHISFTNDRVLPGVNFLYSWDLTDDLSFAGSTQFNSAVDDTGNLYTEWAQSLAVGRSLTDRIGIYGEWFALFPDNAVGIKPEHYLDGGFTYLWTDDVQFDIRAGMGLNDASDDFFAGTGISLRFH